MSRPTAWSYSALDAFEVCPFRYFKTKVEKSVKEPQTQATIWGNQVHKALELRVRDGTALPDGMKQYEPLAAKIAARAQGCTVQTEQKLALTKDFKETTFFAKDVWLRSILDISIEKGTRAFIGDWKTGRKNPNSEQLQLSAAVFFATRPWIDEITNTFLWLQAGEATVEKFHRDDAPEIWQNFLPRVQRLEEAVALQKFPKRPSGLCRAWCPVHTCEHNGKYTGK
jgi:hypothetical protein